MLRTIAYTTLQTQISQLPKAVTIALTFALATSATFLVTSPTRAISDDTLSAATLPPQTFLGRFLVSEIENRIERISGQKLEPLARTYKAREIASAIAEASYTYNVDPFLLLSMIEVESRYNHLAVGTVGELGLMQIKPTTARWISPVTDELHGCNLHEIRCNIMMGATYVSHLKTRTEKRRLRDESGTLTSSRAFREHVLRSYNLGPARADRLASEREPATEIALTAQVSAPASYASKIARRAVSFRSRYMVAAVPVPKAKEQNNIAGRVPQTTSAVAMMQ